MKRRVLDFVGAVLCAGCAASAHASEPLATGIRTEEADREWRQFGLRRARLAFPERAAIGIGGIVARQPRSFDCRRVCEVSGFVFGLDAGVSGGRMSAGYATLMGETPHGGSLLSRVYLGYGIKGALVRSWNDAALSPPRQTLVGIEGEFTIIRIRFDLGLFRPLEPEETADPWVVTGGLGWSF